MKAHRRTTRWGHLAAILLLAWWISGCARRVMPSYPVVLPLDHLLPVVCREASVDLQRWPGTHLTVNAPSAEVFAAARQFLLARGYRVSVEEAAAGCLQTDYRPVRSGRWGSLRFALGFQPALSSRSLVVRVAEEGRDSRVSVWGIAQFGDVDLIAGHPSVRGETRRLAGAIKKQFRKTRRASRSD